MYKQIIDYIMESAMKHIAVNCAKYQSRILINAQNSNKDYQFIIEDDPYFQYNKTSNIYTLTINIDILGHGKDILGIQSETFQIGSELLEYISRQDYFMGLVRVSDFDFLGLSHFTDDDSSGQRLTLQLYVPNPVDLCTMNGNFDEDKGFTVEEGDIDIDLSNSDGTCGKEEDNNGLVLNPVKLPHK